VQVALLGALRRELDQRHGGAGEHTDDGQVTTNSMSVKPVCAFFIAPLLDGNAQRRDAAFARVPDGPSPTLVQRSSSPGARPAL